MRNFEEGLGRAMCVAGALELSGTTLPFLVTTSQKVSSSGSSVCQVLLDQIAKGRHSPCVEAWHPVLSPWPSPWFSLELRREDWRWVYEKNRWRWSLHSNLRSGLSVRTSLGLRVGLNLGVKLRVKLGIS